MKTAIFTIDPQADFHEPTSQHPNPALPVPGSLVALGNLVGFLRKQGSKISTVVTSMDSHNTHHISFNTYWVAADGTDVNPFTPITATDVRDGKYIAKQRPQQALEYLEKLEAAGKFTHVAWPSHCTIASAGHSVMPDLRDAITDWELLTGKNAVWVTKGTYQEAEHFGVLEAEVPSQAGSTQLNQPILNLLLTHDVVYLAGQARTHCVANTLAQIVKYAPELLPRLVILEDCMNNIPGFEDQCQPIYDEAKRLGATFQNA